MFGDNQSVVTISTLPDSFMKVVGAVIAGICCDTLDSPAELKYIILCLDPVLINDSTNSQQHNYLGVEHMVYSIFTVYI